jgi:aspartate/methionine/tyrosine aminotransferase
MYQQYWEQVKVEQSDTTIEIIPSYRTGYEFTSETLIDGQNNPYSIGVVLNKAIRTLHDVAGNAETKDYTIVLGSGGTQLIAAATWAFTQLANQQGIPTVEVFAKTPYYGGYKGWANTYPSVTRFNDSYVQPDPTRIIEFVNVPRNPTGSVNFTAHYSASKYIAHDMVYYWPSLLEPKTLIKAKENVMIFSLSKLSGHAATRFGWALVKDPKVASLMAAFIGHVMIHTSIEGQFRALRVIQHISDQPSFFTYIRTKMQKRWEQLLAVFNEKDPQQQKYAVESVPGQFYVWLHCKQPNVNCYDFLYKHHIVGWEGQDFGIKEKGLYVRMEMVVRDSTFSLILKRLREAL